MLTGSDLDKKENIDKAIMGIDPKKLTSFCVELAESLNEIYSSLYKDDLDNKFTLITRAWINEPTEFNKEKALDFAKASRGYCRIASVEAGRRYSEHDFNHYLSCASILECCYAALMTIKKDNKYVIWCIREYILAREMIVRDFDKDDREEYVNSFKDGIVEKLNEMKERHDQQVDSEQHYTPEAGEECETRNFALGGDWQKCKVIAMHDKEVWMHLERNPTSNIYEVGFYDFRPLKTERDKLFEQACEEMRVHFNMHEMEWVDSGQFYETAISYLIEKGWRPTNDN